MTLPSCYRAFLLRAGHGGAGPYYGLYTLDAWNDFATWVIDDVPNDFLAQPCPLWPGSNPGGAECSEALDLVRYAGTMSLGTQGCTYMMQLIVTGEHRGRVVDVDADGSAPYVVRERDFLAWYERWLNEVLGATRRTGTATVQAATRPSYSQSSMISARARSSAPRQRGR